MNEDFSFISDFEDNLKREHEHLALCEIIPFTTAMARYHCKEENLSDKVYKMSMDPAERFYGDVRCGILHSGQTKGESVLCFGREHAVEIEKGVLYVSVDKFITMMEIYFANYLETLRIPTNTGDRKKFINKMDYICFRRVERA